MADANTQYVPRPVKKNPAPSILGYSPIFNNCCQSRIIVNIKKVRALKSQLGEANFEKLAERIASMRVQFNQRKGK